MNELKENDLNYIILGLMSGTSLDGLDLALCEIKRKNTQWTYRILHSKSIPYHPELKHDLKNSISLSAEALLLLHHSYGTWLGEKAKDFLRKYTASVDYIASHGHTAHHRPEIGLTVQLGSGQHLANASGQKVVCDFRTNDVALGGQGAPLVPIGDRLFFGDYDFCLNLGGISNISFEKNGERLAYDIGLANMILNYITHKIHLNYDDQGQMASKGRLNEDMYKKLNGLPYYRLPYPKSIGYEWFVAEVAPIVDATEDTVPNLLNTAVHHICEMIAQEVNANSHAKEQKSLLVTGGGALNTYLIDVLRQKLGKNIKVVVPERNLIEFKEALIFALMGVLRVEHEINVLKSVTGAERNSCSGVIYLPN